MRKDVQPVGLCVFVQIFGDGADVHDGEKWGHGGLRSQPPLKNLPSCQVLGGRCLSIHARAPFVDLELNTVEPHHDLVFNTPSPAFPHEKRSGPEGDCPEVLFERDVCEDRALRCSEARAKELDLALDRRAALRLAEVEPLEPKPTAAAA